MQAAEDRCTDDARPAGTVPPVAARWRLSKGLMRTRRVVVGHIRPRQATQMPIVENDNAFETLAA